MRSGALLHVNNDMTRSVAIGCEFGLNVRPDHDKGNYDLATIGLDRHIHSQFVVAFVFLFKIYCG